MKPFEFEPHTADLRLRVFGNTMPELFAHAMAGLFFALGPHPVLSDSRTRAIDVSSSGREELLVDFLNELIALTDTHKEAYTKLDIIELADERIRATVSGTGVSRFDLQVKSATYHDLAIKNVDGALMATVVFDI
jgi:SHS2 domain-containing protein